MKLSHLKTGDRIVVRNGAKGEQVAIVETVASAQTARVRKWLMRGGRWTQRVTVYEVELLRYASSEDFRKRRVNCLPA